MVTNSAHLAMHPSRGCRQPVINPRVMHCANAHAGACLHDSSAIKALPPQTKRCVVMLLRVCPRHSHALCAATAARVQMSAIVDCFKHPQLKPRQDIGAATHGWVGHLSAREITTLVPPRSMAASACVLRPTLFIEHLMFSQSPVPAPACSCMCEKISQWYLSAKHRQNTSPRTRDISIEALRSSAAV